MRSRRRCMLVAFIVELVQKLDNEPKPVPKNNK